MEQAHLSTEKPKTVSQKTMSDMFALYAQGKSLEDIAAAYKMPLDAVARIAGGQWWDNKLAQVQASKSNKVLDNDQFREKALADYAKARAKLNGQIMKGDSKAAAVLAQITRSEAELRENTQEKRKIELVHVIQLPTTEALQLTQTQDIPSEQASSESVH